MLALQKCESFRRVKLVASEHHNLICHINTLLEIFFSSLQNMGEKVDFDSILEQIGYFGKWQKRIFFYLSFTSFAAGLLVVVYTFTAFDTKYMCNIPQCELNYNGSHWLSKEESRLIPTPGKCQYYELEEGLTCSQYLDSIDPATSQRANCSGSDLVFDNSYVKSSLSKFNFTQKTFKFLLCLNFFL